MVGTLATEGPGEDFLADAVAALCRAPSTKQSASVPARLLQITSHPDRSDGVRHRDVPVKSFACRSLATISRTYDTSLALRSSFSCPKAYVRGTSSKGVNHTIEGGCDFLARNSWKREGDDRIVSRHSRALRNGDGRNWLALATEP